LVEVKGRPVPLKRGFFRKPIPDGEKYYKDKIATIRQ